LKLSKEEIQANDKSLQAICVNIRMILGVLSEMEGFATVKEQDEMSGYYQALGFFLRRYAIFNDKKPTRKEFKKIIMDNFNGLY